MTHIPVLASGSFVLLQDNPKRPGTASYLRYEIYKSASTKTEFHMLGGTSADLLWGRKKQEGLHPSLFVTPPTRWTRATLLMLMMTRALNLTTELT